MPMIISGIHANHKPRTRWKGFLNELGSLPGQTLPSAFFLELTLVSPQEQAGASKHLIRNLGKTCDQERRGGCRGAGRLGP